MNVDERLTAMYDALDRMHDPVSGDGSWCPFHDVCGVTFYPYGRRVEPHEHGPKCPMYAPEPKQRPSEARPAPKATCGWCRGNPIVDCIICQAKPSTPETYADDPPQRTNEAFYACLNGKCDATVAGHSVMCDRCKQAWQMGHDYPRTDYPRPKERGNGFADTIEKIIDAVEMTRPTVDGGIDALEFRNRVGVALREFHAGSRPETPSKFQPWTASAFLGHVRSTGTHQERKAARILLAILDKPSPPAPVDDASMCAPEAPLNRRCATHGFPLRQDGRCEQAGPVRP